MNRLCLMKKIAQLETFYNRERALIQEASEELRSRRRRINEVARQELEAAQRRRAEARENPEVPKASTIVSGSTEWLNPKNEASPTIQSEGTQPMQVEAQSTKRTREAGERKTRIKEAPPTCLLPKGERIGVPAFKAPPIGKAKVEAAPKPIMKAPPPSLDDQEDVGPPPPPPPEEPHPSRIPNEGEVPGSKRVKTPDTRLMYTGTQVKTLQRRASREPNKIPDPKLRTIQEVGAAITEEAAAKHSTRSAADIINDATTKQSRRRGTTSTKEPTTNM